MTPKRFAFASIIVTALAMASLPFVVDAQNTSLQLSYPKTRKVDHVDTYFGTKVPDDYRWLEDDNSAETARWVEEQNKVSFAYLERIPYRQRIRERLEKLYNYPKIGAPSRRGEYYYFSKE